MKYFHCLFKHSSMGGMY